MVEEVFSRRFNAFLDELSFSEGPEEPAEPAPPVADTVREAIESALPAAAAPTPSLDDLRAMVEDALDRRLASFQDDAAAPAAAVHQAVEDLRREVTESVAALRDTPAPPPATASEPGVITDQVAAVVGAAVDRLREELAAAPTPPPPPAPAVDADAIAAEVRAAMATEIDPLREELTSLRRRLGVRARATEPALSDQQLTSVADAVAEVVVARLQDSFELADEEHGA